MKLLLGNRCTSAVLLCSSSPAARVLRRRGQPSPMRHLHCQTVSSSSSSSSTPSLSSRVLSKSSTSCSKLSLSPCSSIPFSPSSSPSSSSSRPSSSSSSSSPAAPRHLRYLRDPARRVALVGATHGNEDTGLAVVDSMVPIMTHVEGVNVHVHNVDLRSSTATYGRGKSGSLRQQPQPTTDGDFQLDVVVANPAAIRARRRYVEEDLNRCFLSSRLAEARLGMGRERDDGGGESIVSAEMKRAVALDAILGPKASPHPHIDLVRRAFYKIVFV